MRELTESDVTFCITCAPEDLQIEGNCLASGDDEVDRQAAESIRADLESGNEWAWCRVIVTAEWEGRLGADSLGGCSYANEGDFKTGGYFEDMKRAALADLNQQIAELAAELAANLTTLVAEHPREYAQGARCGHIEGKGRAGLYVLGEEWDPSVDAARINADGLLEQTAWAAGYRHGYRLAAAGEELEPEHVNAELPE
jgi:hypothetical protein